MRVYVLTFEQQNDSGDVLLGLFFSKDKALQEIEHWLDPGEKIMDRAQTDYDHYTVWTNYGIYTVEGREVQ